MHLQRVFLNKAIDYFQRNLHLLKKWDSHGCNKSPVSTYPN